MLSNIKRSKSSFLIALCLLFCSISAFASTPDKVRTYKDDKGWKLEVNGKDLYIKGMVWGYSPRNENYTYNLWAQSEEDIKNVLDHDFSLMSKAGVNAIRAFSNIPPKWVEYINETYQIKTIINPLMGRYGSTIGGRFVPFTDYSDPLTRKTLKKEVLEVIEKYKNVPGVIMFALGNESNYGLSWKSFEIENLPKGEQNTARAEFLYSLFAETIKEGKKLTQNHPITIVNGDIQYIDLIAKYGKDWELLGVNSYRGENFTSLWKDAKNKINMPVLFFEFGSDAFNSKLMEEDEASQAKYLQRQWQDMYNNTYDKGYGNSIGGFVFEWRDEWWKYKQTENLDIHDRTASWSNGGYAFDYEEGKNNMNEEWFGVTRLGEINKKGVYIAEPRMAYDVLNEVFKLDPINDDSNSINSSIEAINIEEIAKKIEQRNKENNWGEKTGLKFLGGSIKLEHITRSYDTFNPNKNETNRNESEFGQSAFLGFGYDYKNFSAEMVINAIGKAANSDFQQRYEDRVATEDDKNIELYSFKATYHGDKMDLNAFYHVPRFHWGYEGDFYGLMREVTDMDGTNGQDIWDSKAPYGVEFVGKDELDGLKIVGGEEVYWGANPKVVLKYQFGENKQYSFMHSEDYGEKTSSSSSTDTTSSKSRQTALYGKFQFGSGTQLELGGLISGTRKIDDVYDYMENGTRYVGDIEAKDTLGAKAKLSFVPFENGDAYLGLNYAGLVANGGEPLKEDGTQLPYSEYGNKIELDAGVKIINGNYTIYPRIFYRDSLLDANPLIKPSINGTTLTPGIVTRNLDSDPFAVLGNRAARAAEIYFTYDPTPGTYFYQWDNDLRENADFAYNLGFTYIDYTTDTDSYTYYSSEYDSNYAFATGLSEEEVWMLKSRMVFNPQNSIKSIIELEVGKQQSTGNPTDAINYSSIKGKIVLNSRDIFAIEFAKDKWGPYDYQRQFNVTYPEQWKFEYTRLLDKGLSEKDSSKFGIKFFHRTLDGGSEGEWAQTVNSVTEINENMSEFQVFYTYKF